MELTQGYWVKSEQGTERHNGEDSGPESGTLKIQDLLHEWELPGSIDRFLGLMILLFGGALVNWA